MKMTTGKRKAAVFHGAGKPFTVKSYPISAPAAGMVGLSLTASGICGTDVHIHDGRLGMPDFPLIIGHEFLGKVDAIGADVTQDGLGRVLAKGDQAVACVAIPCGVCFNCRRGETASCMAFGVTYAQNAEEAPHFFGGLAEYLYSPAQNLVRLPDGVDALAAAAVPCGGPTVIRSCAYGGGLKAGELVVVQGNGPLGLFALAWAKAHDCRVVVIGSATNPLRLELMQAWKPELFLDYRKADAEAIKRELSRMTDADGADVVIETSGARDAFPLGLQLLRKRGRYFVPGQYSNSGAVTIEPQLITFQALQIIGSGQYTMADILTYLEFLARHPEWQPLFAKMVSKYRVDDVNQAMADAKAGKVIKAVVTA